MLNEMHLRWFGVLVVSGAAALHDWKSGHIPNWIAGLGLSLGVGVPVIALAATDAAQALARAGGAALGFVACGAVPLLLFRLNALAGGDVKLLAAMGALLGPTLGLELSFAAFAVALLYWPARFIQARAALARAARTAPATTRRTARATTERSGPATERLAIAFAPCLFVAAIALSASHWRM